MDIKTNINRIHYELSSKYDNIKIEELSSIKFGKYFQITINESKMLKIILPYKNIDNKKNIEWFYFSNPLNEKSDLVIRNTSIDDILVNINEIFANNRFSEEYLKN